jgi:hypothetical protein
MGLRTIVAVAAALLAIVTCGWLSYAELVPDADGRTGIAPSEVTVRHLVRKEDPLFDLKYLPADREENLKAYGLPGPLVKRALDRAAGIEEDYGQKLRLMMRDTEDPQRLLDAVCGQTSEQRPRYGLLRYLVSQDGPERVPIDLKRASSLELQEWAVLAPIDTVYETVEFDDARHADATLMGVAAIIAQQEEKVTKRQAPWGSGGIGRAWEWERVVADHPGVDTKVVEYFAMMLVAAEVAHGSDGVCTN